jgi:hypothetical protein
MVRSRRKLRSFTVLTIPGRGSGNNKRVIEDEAATDNIELVESHGLISTKYIRNNQ